MDVIPEIRRLHFVEKVTISDLAKQFKLSRPTIRKHLKTVEEPVYPTRQHETRRLSRAIDDMAGAIE